MDISCSAASEGKTRTRSETLISREVEMEVAMKFDSPRVLVRVSRTCEGSQ